jgi:hypothetical protein
MTAIANNEEVRFRTFKEYKDYFAPSPHQPEYPPDKMDDPYYIWGIEVANRAFEKVKQRMEEEKQQAPWEKQPSE